MLRALFASFLLISAAAAHAASVAQALTPMNTSVLGGERQVYSVRFLGADGRPAVGENVVFDNDACGTFDGGGFTMSTRTDADGVASMGFTARPQGITCSIIVQAGASVTFNVHTYTLGQVSLSGETSPADVPVYQGFTFNARVYAGAYPIYNAEITARVVSGVDLLYPPPPDHGNTGQDGYVPFRFQFGVLDDFEIEIGFRGITKRFNVRLAFGKFQDLWWAGPAENGWGLSIVQHGDRIFAVLFVYDSSGAPVWYVIPGGTWNAARTVFTGSVYSPRGTPYTNYDASRLVVGPARGTVQITFASTEDATLAYEIDGASGTKRISRQPFGPRDTTRPTVVGSRASMNWGGPTQNGWGVALMQQYRTLFLVWFTYGADGAPIWYVMPEGYWSDVSTWSGPIYRTTGSPWLGRTYDPARLTATLVGNFTLRSQDFFYTLDAKPGMMKLMVQDF